MRQSPPNAGLSFPGAQDLWRISPTGTGETDLTNTPYASDGTHSDECCGEYSPDGTKIVYANGFNSDPLEAESNDIWVMNANGSNQHALTGPHDYPIQDVGPSWSPDGTKIVFSRTSTGNGSDGLYLIDSDGTDLTPIKNGAAHVAGNSPTFSPDGTLIAFSNGSRIVTVPPTGGAPVPVTPLGTSPDYPSWSGGGGSSDTTAPQTTITSGPPAMTKLRNVKLGFASSETGSHFQCKLDGASVFTACSSPKSYSGLGDGKHSFRVRAIDAAANVDPTPATRTFTVDATPPKTTITSGPSGKIRSHRAKFGFASSEPGSHFQCRLDGGAYAPCTSPAKYKGLKHGRHTFNVRAIDKLGNVDATAASRSFKVKR